MPKRYQNYIKTTPYQKAKDKAEKELSAAKSNRNMTPSTDEADMLATRARKGMGTRTRDERYIDPQSVYGSNNPALERKRKSVIQPLVSGTDSILVAGGGGVKTLMSHIKKKKKAMSRDDAGGNHSKKRKYTDSFKGMKHNPMYKNLGM